MLIDWFTVGAQALNFLILVWLLKRFLYKPILDAIDAREKGIAAELADAAAKQAEAKTERDGFRAKSEEFDHQRADLWKRATDGAAAERQKLLDAAAKDADAVRAKRQEALRAEGLALSRDIGRWAQDEVFAVARKALADLAGAGLEERVCDVFVRRLRGLTGPAREQLAAALRGAAGPVPVRSAFDLPPAQQAAVRTALNETCSADLHVQFETVPELLGGIEVSANGQKVAWGIGEYLGGLEQSAAELLHEEDKAPEKLAPEAAAALAEPTRPKTKADPTDAGTPAPKT